MCSSLGHHFDRVESFNIGVKDFFVTSNLNEMLPVLETVVA